MATGHPGLSLEKFVAKRSFVDWNTLVVHNILLPMTFGCVQMKSHIEGTVMREPEDMLQNVISTILVIPKEDF
jgi:hypothetical protein